MSIASTGCDAAWCWIIWEFRTEPRSYDKRQGGIAFNTNIEENAYVIELLDILRDNGKDASGLAALLTHMKDMENFVKSAESQITDMKCQLDSIKEVQDHPIRTALQNTIKTLEAGIAEVKAHLTNLKSSISEGCKNAVSAFRDKGITALDKVTSFLHAKPVLESIKKEANANAKHCDRAIAKIEAFSKEYHNAGLGIRNMARVLIDKKPIDAPKEAGKLAKALCSLYKTEKSYMQGICNAADKAIGKIEQLESSAGAICGKKATMKPGLLEKLAENKEKIRLLDLEKYVPERLPKAAEAQL
ncbi:MAG: hypothetical protein FWE20_12320 [Defluviitaleaceae bacterium]|nr:hypothetical protein [Defluviitaleaceae bacterium]